ncbi:hypothetical protein H8E52_10300 [bacterium]|nr:hypothetical protein [bacterium]
MKAYFSGSAKIILDRLVLNGGGSLECWQFECNSPEMLLDLRFGDGIFAPSIQALLRDEWAVEATKQAEVKTIWKPMEVGDDVSELAFQSCFKDGHDLPELAFLARVGYRNRACD